MRNSTQKDTIRAEDGTELKVKEGVVIDSDGNELNPSKHRPGFDQPRVIVWRGGRLAPFLLVPAVLLFLTFGITLLGIFAAIFFFVTLVMTLMRVFVSPRR